MISKINPEGLSDTITVFRARVFITCIIALILFSLTIGSYYTFLVAQDESSFKLLLLMTLFTIVLFAICIIACQFTGQIKIIGHVLLLWIYLILIFIYAFVGGGPTYSTTTPLILLATCIAFSSTGLRGGIIWSAVYIVSYAAFVIAEINGTAFLRLIASDFNDTNRYITWCFVLLILILFLSSYEWMIATLTNEHGGNYSKLYEIHNTVSVKREVIDHSLFQDYVYQAINRNSHYGDFLSFIIVDIKIIAANLQEDLVSEANRRIDNQLRATDTILRINKSRLAVICENIPADKNHQLLCQNIERSILKPYFIEGFNVEFQPKITSYLYPRDSDVIYKQLGQLN